MITVTDNAVRQLRILLETQSPEHEAKVCASRSQKADAPGLQYEMSLDGQKAGDAIVEKDGVEFLVDSESAEFLRGATLDYHDGLTGTGFQIVNPNAARTCGCGTSFEPPALLENESFAKRARVDGSRLFPLRGLVRASPAEKQPVRLDDRHPSPDRSRLRRLAREFLHLRPTGAAGQLSHPEKAAQDRAEPSGFN